VLLRSKYQMTWSDMRTREQTGQDLIEELLASRQRFLDFVSRRVSEPELAEDIVQEALLRAIQSADRLRDDTRLIPWFYQLLRNAIIDNYRRRDIDPPPCAASAS
jgi:RNA polymerase sigma factor (sigma-70 family)